MNKSNRMSYSIVMSLVAATIVVSGCKKKEETEVDSDVGADAAYYVIETSVTEAGDFAKSVEAEELTLSSKSFATQRSITPLTLCDYTTARTECDTTNFQTTVQWNSCSLSTTTSVGTATATLKGTITETYSGFGAAMCAMTGNGSQIKRVISSTDPWVLTFANNATLTRDMDPGTAWDGTTFPTASEGTAVTRIETGTSNGLTCAANARCYNIVANGLHKTFKGPKGRTWFEHIVNSDVSFTGAKSAGTRTMAGSVSVWHELAQYKAVNTFTNVTWGSASCCYPTAGSISTTLTGSLTGSMSMAFGATCGEVTVTNTDATQSTVNLTQCSE